MPDNPIAILASRENIHRLGPGMISHRPQKHACRHLDTHLSTSRIIQSLREWNPAGLIVEYREDLIEALFAFHKPMVWLMADLLVDGVTCLNVDDHAMGKMAWHHLRDRGFQNFAYIGWDRPEAPQRLDGFTSAQPANQHSPQIFLFDSPAQSIRQLSEWLRALPQNTGIFVGHEPLADTVLAAAVQADRKIPDDLALIIATDDPYRCEWTRPTLTHIEVPWQNIGAEAIRALEAQIQGIPAPAHVQLIQPATVHVRESTAWSAVAHPLVRRALEYASHNLDQSFNVDIWSKHLHTNRRTLERAFRLSLNQTPNEALLRLRLERAREWMANPSLSLSQISDRCGFSNPAKLSLHFRTIFGQSPSSYRKHITFNNQK